MDGGGLTDAERDGQRFLADFKKRMGEEEAKVKEEAKVRRRARAAKAGVECGGHVMGEGNLAERGWSNGCLWGGETRPKNPLRGD